MPNKRNLLIVDDDPDLLRLLKAELPDRVSVQTAQSWHAARYLLDKSRYDLILLDLLLPDAEPLETLRDIRDIDRDYPVVVMSGQLELTEELLDRIMACGILRVLKKPFGSRELQTAIPEILGS